MDLYNPLKIAREYGPTFIAVILKKIQLTPTSFLEEMYQGVWGKYLVTLNTCNFSNWGRAQIQTLYLQILESFRLYTDLSPPSIRELFFHPPHTSIYIFHYVYMCWKYTDLGFDIFLEIKIVWGIISK